MIQRYLPILILSFLMSQDIAGSYEFRGLYAIYQNIARYDTDIIVTNAALNISYPVRTIAAGEIYRTTYQGPYGHNTAQALNVNVNVSFYPDGTGSILEGSILPTDEINIESCSVAQAFTPFTDDLIYSSNLNAGLVAPDANILGYVPNANNDYIAEQTGNVVNGMPALYENPLRFQGMSTGSISLSQSATFDFFPATPMHPTLCDGDGNCFDVILDNGTTITGGQPLPGFTGGYALKGKDLLSIAPTENACSELYLEWHAIDGPTSGAGLGDNIGVDDETEDWDGDGLPGDGTDFDRIWALQKLQGTLLVAGSNPQTGTVCNYNYPVLGDLQENMLGIESDCIQEDPLIETNEFYIMDPTHFADYSNFFTYNAYHGIVGDDSDHDYSGTNTDGRLIWSFDSQCIPDVMVRQIMLEFLEIGSNPYDGDLNHDGNYNVLDIVGLANCVLVQTCMDTNGCSADLNIDGNYNVLDIVALANCVLAQTCDN